MTPGHDQHRQRGPVERMPSVMGRSPAMRVADSGDTVGHQLTFPLPAAIALVDDASR